jgi:hypothetical protein
MSSYPTPTRPDGKRPGVVTTAAVTALVLAGLVVVAKTVALLVLATQTSAALADSSIWVVGADYMIMMAKLGTVGLLVWGAIAALRGQTRQILVAGSATLAVLSVSGVLVGPPTFPGAGRYSVTAFLELAFVALIGLLLLLPSSADYFRATRSSLGPLALADTTFPDDGGPARLVPAGLADQVRTHLPATRARTGCAEGFGVLLLHQG